LKAFTLALLGIFGLAAAIVTWSFLKPPPEASQPVQARAIEQSAPAAGDPPARVFEIAQGQSQARFFIDEVLRGTPKTVVGVTNQVAGQIALDPTDPDSARIGTILINARTFATDSTQRDRVVQNQVLQTAEHEYITFEPTELTGLPTRAAIGEALRLQVAGKLTIRGVTRPVTFDATITPETADRLKGSASTTIRYADWAISIPQVSAVTGVADTVRLELDFVALAA